jgi:hypothetical protein
MTMTAEYQMINELIDQVRCNNTVLVAARQCAQTPDEIREIEEAIETNIALVEKAREALKDVPKQA